MNLTDLQMELRCIEEHISSLHLEIEKMKPKAEDNKKEEYDKITKLARQHPIKGTQIEKAPDVVKKEYVTSLTYLLLTDERQSFNTLLYLSRISIGSILICQRKKSIKQV